MKPRTLDLDSRVICPPKVPTKGFIVFLGNKPVGLLSKMLEPNAAQAIRMRIRRNGMNDEQIVLAGVSYTVRYIKG